MKIKKLNNLKNVESFVQISYLKGFKYIDKAGEILNRYQGSKGEIEYNISSERLIIKKPLAGLEDLKVSNIDIWAHFVEPSNLGKIKQVYLKEFNSIIDIVDVGTVERIGWRNFFVIDIEKGKNTDGILPVKDMHFVEVTMKKTMGAINLNCIVKPLSKVKEDSKAILFDIDVFFMEQIDCNEVSSKMEELKNALEGNEIKQLINDILGKI
ncbi:hypothetical protein [Dehalobacter restrictus]|uniref:hypothetical protein n=1 Tax=Dehalobacter restrictus TaxID=55583 RepID=UPI00338E0D89